MLLSGEYFFRDATKSFLKLFWSYLLQKLIMFITIKFLSGNRHGENYAWVK